MLQKILQNNNHLQYLNNIYDNKFIKILKQIKNPILVGTDCSGIEAPIMSLKLLNIDFIHKFSCEIDEKTVETIKSNYNSEIIYSDILTRNHTTLPYIDLYIAGFPCQSFSAININKNIGFKDKKKGIIFFECYDVIKNKLPKVFILENVKSLVSHEKGQTFKTILKLLNSINKYKIYWKILNTKDYNLPQNRPRIYIVGIRTDIITTDFKFPEPILSTLKIRDILDNNDLIDTEYLKKLSHLTDHKKKLLEEYYEDYNDLYDKDYLVNLNISGGGRFKSCIKDISPCLLAGNSAFYITSYKRKLLPKEGLKLQGFSNDFKMNCSESRKYGMIGNSMSSNILSFLYKSILESTTLGR